jgi:HEAT repeat protein
MLDRIAHGSLADFNLYFARLRKMFPQEVAEACLFFIASRKIDPIGRSMAFWLSSQGTYVDILFGSDALPPHLASKALIVLKSVDEAFYRRFLQASERISSPQAILRALSLLPALGDFGILIPWLRKLCLHADERVKSRSVKVLCQLRPNKALIERQMLSDDPRVRANAVEALWGSRSLEATALFNSASLDSHHRVVGNALIGLHLQDDPSAMVKMIAMSKNPDPMFRAATAWSLGITHDERAVPVLELLSGDPSEIVRKRALASLLLFQPAQTAAPSEK